MCGGPILLVVGAKEVCVGVVGCHVTVAFAIRFVAQHPLYDSCGENLIGSRVVLQF